MRGLYAIADSQYLTPDKLLDRCKQVLDNGCKVLQYRDKTSDQAQWLEQASALHTLCKRYQAEFIINDYLPLAAELGCGLHLGKDDISIAEARTLLGSEATIGASCYSSIKTAQQAAEAGASYLAFGRFYPSATKPDAPAANPTVLSAAKTFGLPIVAIGGITPDNGGQLISAGADALAVISDLWTAADLNHQCQRYTQLFKEPHD